MIALAMLEATAAATPLERGESRHLVWNDEFNGRAIDPMPPSDWTYGRWAVSGEIDYVRVWASEHSVASR